MLEIMRENAQSWIIKILFAIIILAFVLTFGLGGFNDKGDPIVAYVDDDPISRVEFETKLARFVENLRQNKNLTPAQLESPELKQMVLNDMISRRLLLREAGKLGITISNEEVYKAISSMPAFWNKDKRFDKERYTALLRRSRTTPEQFEADFRQNLLQGKLQRFVTKTAQGTPEQGRAIYNWLREQARIKYLIINPEDFLEKAEVTDEAVAKFYQDNLDKFQKPATAKFEYIAFTPRELAAAQPVSEEELKAYYEAHKESYKQKEQVKARHILIALAPTATPAEVEQGLERIKKVLAQAKKGKDFAELAMEYSEGPSAATGGELGWFGHGAMVQPFEEAAFAMKKGAISEPVRTDFGWHIIKVEDRKESRQQDFDEVKNRLRDTIAEDKAADKVSDLLDESMDRLFSGMTLKEIAKELKLDVSTTPMVSAQQVQQVFGMTAEAAEVLFAAPLAEKPKTPLAIEGGYVLAEKLKDEPSAPIPMETVKDSIRKSLRAQEAADLARKQAEDILARLTGEEAIPTMERYKSSIKTSEAFRRQGPIPALGQNQQLIAATFKAEEKSWLPEVYRTQAGFIVASLAERIAAPADEWEKERDAWIKTATDRYSQEMFQAYLEALRAEASIEIVRPDLLN